MLFFIARLVAKLLESLCHYAESLQRRVMEVSFKARIFKRLERLFNKNCFLSQVAFQKMAL